VVDISNTGHVYLLNNHESDTQQGLTFIEKEKQLDGSFKTIRTGTTNEEVLKVLIDRTKKLGEKLPSRENSLALTKLQEALMWFEARTKARIEQGVENTPLPHKS